MIDRSSGLCSNGAVMEETISQYLARIGAKGGKTTGKSKRRGGKAYYARIAKKGWRNRRLRENEGRTAK
jgi:hypothetical protein